MVKATKHLPRIERLRELAQLPGIYVPIFYTATYNEDGTLRDTVVYSMTAAEWPDLKAKLTT